jgi:hypothetical protein
MHDNWADDITQEEIREWTSEYNGLPDDHPLRENDHTAKVQKRIIVEAMKQIDPNWTIPDPYECFMASSWFDRELRKLNPTDEDRADIHNALGQMQVHYSNSWEPARIMLDAYKSGTWDRPGRELAEKLCKQFLKLPEPPPKGEILKTFFKLNMSDLKPDETNTNGITVPSAVMVDGNGEVSVMAIAMFGKHATVQTYQAIHKFLIEENPIELVFGIDRFTKDGQGTTRNNVFSVTYFNRGVFKFGIIEYDLWPEVEVDEIRWDCEHWNNALKNELVNTFRDHRVKMGPGISFDMEPYPPRFADLEVQHLVRLLELTSGERYVEAEAYLERQGIPLKRIKQYIEFFKERSK